MDEDKSLHHVSHSLNADFCFVFWSDPALSDFDTSLILFLSAFRNLHYTQ